MQSPATFSCFKCNGSGRVAFRHIEGGICFQCKGAGRLSYRPREAVAAEPHPDLLVPASERATDKQWGYLLHLVAENDDAFCRFVRAAGGKLANQKYVSRSVMSRAIELAKEAA